MNKEEMKKYEKECRQMFIDQNDKCAICNKRFLKKRDVCVDLNHETGHVRQLLCSKCNYGIGHFNENTDTLIQAAEYIKKWSKNE